MRRRDAIDMFICDIKYEHVPKVTQKMLDDFSEDFKKFAEKYDWIEEEISWCNSNSTLDGG